MPIDIPIGPVKDTRPLFHILDLIKTQKGITDLRLAHKMGAERSIASQWRKCIARGSQIKLPTLTRFANAMGYEVFIVLSPKTSKEMLYPKDENLLIAEVV